MKLNKGLKLTLKAAITFIVLAIVLFFAREFISNIFLRVSLTGINPAGKNDRVLVVAPHCDDEALGSAEFIKKTLKNGGRVKVVLITNGDGFKSALQFDYLNIHPRPIDYIRFGYERQKESLKALKRLGLSEDNVTFLGYPDGGIAYLFYTNWDKGEPYTSSDTATDKTPYNNSYAKGAIYCGENLEADFEKIITDYKPNYIIYPHPNDRHPDHMAVNAFIKYTITKLNYKPDKELLYLVHRGDWPTPLKRDTNMYLVPPAKLAYTGTNWHALDMNNTDISEKSEVIHYYKTQIKVLAPLMTAFERKNELFGEYSNVALRSTGEKDDSIAPNTSNIVIINPEQDTLGLEIAKGANILGIHAEQSNTNNLHVFVVLDDEFDSFIQYNLNVIYFKGTDSKRLNILFKDNKVFSMSTGTKSMVQENKIINKSKGSILHFIIPDTLSGEFDHAFINMNSSVGDRVMDRTAWRMMEKFGGSK
jgi:LmbE family N-acetylglucosaminyl deacetylase